MNRRFGILARWKTKRESLEESERYYVATPRQLMWWKFRKHKLAVVSLYILGFMYLIAIFAEFVSPYNPNERHIRQLYAPRQKIHWIYNGRFHLRPAVFTQKFEIDPETLREKYYEVPEEAYPIRLFARGDRYRMWGLFETDLHLFGVEPGGTVFLFGTDRMGRDMLSRIIAGARISLSIGFVGIALSFILGLILGGISGYFGGVADLIIQRLIEVMRAFPAIPLWMGLSAALPMTWSPLKVYFAITVILSLLGWVGVARAIRGKFLALREEDFAVAAYLAGASKWRIIYKHLLPSFMSHIIVVLTLAIPHMIIAETALSYLGLGLRPPITSWGVLLKETQNIQDMAHHPWLLLPVLFIILVILAFNFVGDGLRDAADPYAT
ncbi:MAG: ABC transporter permease [Fidelibacterota bacterium]|nr:MAG: ABC transporter permease [Candidatus Neomarinimicrobiota bacterium]